MRLGKIMRTTGNHVTYRQQTVLRQAFESYRFAVEAFGKAGFEVPAEVLEWEDSLAAMSVTVMARCLVCKGSFPVEAPLRASISAELACPSCVAELEALDFS